MSAVLLGDAGAWSFEPVQLFPLLAAAVAYALRVRSLVRRRRGPGPWRITAFAAAIAVLGLALSSPLDTLAEGRSFAAHMAQHLAIADVAAACLVLSVTGPVLRPLLAVDALRALRPLLHPVVALVLWATCLSLWHLPVAYEAALRHDGVHALQHACFLAAGLLLWGALLEPLPGPGWFTAGWRLVYLGAAQVVQILLGSVFLWSGRVFYDTYASAPRYAGLSARADQALGGAVMLGEATVVMAVAASWAFFALMRESEARQSLLEHGASERVAARSARYRGGHVRARTDETP